ncbi:MAG: DUF1206 domain-containing protein [Phaeodactylibacter xiamenensis]|uniref:DUF1206 domain-containing protein n=1 Tax=Phaeodactylibacter xiamenensis TaxID=1524460 RepID=UPI000695F7FC|nr:DUF1206 domain-containing protein [Phaeodactylibacter xiamenensis]MCR9052365.1 DUF1206 domain-containing protein [bacterium]
MLGLTALGLAAYALWRLYETFSNSDAIFQEDEKKTGKRLRHFYSAVVYGLLAYTFAKPLFGGSSGSGGDSKQDALGMLLQQSPRPSKMRYAEKGSKPNSTTCKA